MPAPPCAISGVFSVFWLSGDGDGEDEGDEAVDW